MSEFEYTEEHVKKAFDVILADTKSWSKSLNYAINYVKAGQWMHGHELQVQCLYILNNITGWRHPRAKEVRTCLKTFSKYKLKD